VDGDDSDDDDVDVEEHVRKFFCNFFAPAHITIGLS